MSERSINENNKLWEAAERIAEKAVADKKAANEEERRKQKKRIIKIVLLMVLIALIIVFASIAWFAMNKAVSADTMAIEAKDAPFEIAVKGSSVRNDAEFIKADSNYTYGIDKTYDNESFKETGGSEQQIKIRYTPTAGDSNVFGPASSGQIDFYIVPKQDGDLTVRIDLESIGFKEIGEGSSKQIKRISDLTSTDIPDADVLAQYRAAEQYLKGHIMFFETKGNAGTGTTSEYYYTKPITERTFTRTFANARKDVPQLVTIYWMWTNTLGQIALKNDTSLDGFQRNGIPIVPDILDSATDPTLDKNKVIKYLKDNKAQIFANEVTDAEIDGAKTKANFDKLSTGYNNADFEIGSCLNYFTIEITVGQPNAS